MLLRQTVGFIGLGVMGHSMAGHILEAPYPLVVHSRTRTAAVEMLLANGAVWAETPAMVAAQASIVITMVGYPSEVEEVYFGEHGILASATSGALLIDMSTSSPALARRIAEAAAAQGLHALDAPVSGGDLGARNATLTIMAGGEHETFARAVGVFETMGRTIVHEGPAGAGQHTKMCNQIAIASGMIGVVEALAYAESAGLDPHRVLEAIGAGAAGSWSLTNLAPRMLEGDMAPGFYVKHFIKDMRIALDSAAEMGLDLPGLALAEGLYERLAAAGWSDAGTQALYQLYHRAEGDASASAGGPGA